MSLSVKKFPKIPKKRYNIIRKDLRSGDILLCSGTGVFSKLIQKATGSVWSHVGFIIRLDSIDRVMVLESVESIGVRTIPLSSYVKDYNGSGRSYKGKVVIARHALAKSFSIPQMKKMTQFAVDLFGYPYDKDEIVKIAARIAMGFLIRKEKALKHDKEYICSEYAWHCYKKLGITIPHDKKGFIAPKDFARDKRVDPIARIV